MTENKQKQIYTHIYSNANCGVSKHITSKTQNQGILEERLKMHTAVYTCIYTENAHCSISIYVRIKIGYTRRKTKNQGIL